MRKLSLALLCTSSMYAVTLPYISNTSDEARLKELSQKYKQELLINDGKVYLIPSDCRLNRYFGGASELKVKLAKRPEQTEDIVITQEVFEAKDEETIKESIEVQKSISLVEGKVSEEFLMDKEGRGFGGASELPLNYSFQKIKAVKVNMTPAKKQKPIVEDAKPYQHPTCRILEDGSGYKIENLKNAQFYKNGNIEDIKNENIKF